MSDIISCLAGSLLYYSGRGCLQIHILLYRRFICLTWPRSLSRPLELTDIARVKALERKIEYRLLLFRLTMYGHIEQTLGSQDAKSLDWLSADSEMMDNGEDVLFFYLLF